jgi:uncharacterized membrane protein YdjX (TVP38/TMEM64 family)
MRWLTGAMAIAAIAAAVAWLPMGAYLARLLEAVRGTGPWGPVVLALAYVVATVLFVSGAVMTLGSGFLFGLAVGTLTVSLGSIVGASAAFGIGRWIARGWVQRKLAHSRRWQALDEAVGRQAFKTVLLVRLSPVFPFVLTNYAFSLTNIRFREFFLASWIGTLPGTLLYVYLGSTAKDLTDIVRGTYQGGMVRNIALVAGLLATVVVTTIIARAARSALKRASAVGEDVGV